MNMRQSPCRPPRGQRGVTLIVALVMLVVIGLTSAAVMRSALGTDTITNNTRVQLLAMQAAQIGLRYCETELAKATPGITVYAASAAGAERWRSFANWQGTGTTAVTTVPQSQMKSDNTPGAMVPTKLPQCLAEKHPTLTATYIVTARGFSADYDADSSGYTKAGSVVWLQSIQTIGS